MRRALVTGIAGQDGSYLAELLLSKGYEVFGLCRREAVHYPLVDPAVSIVRCDLADGALLRTVVRNVQPAEVYHLASQSTPSLSLSRPFVTADTNAMGTLRLLEAVVKECPEARLYNASTSEVFANTLTTPQDETTEFAPRNTYGASKAFAQMVTKVYREQHDLHASSGVLFNHESPRRPVSFVTRKITNAAARISLGLQDVVELGDLEARRDWGFAGDYVLAMWLMLQQPGPSDFVIGSGVTHSVRDLCDIAFREVGLDYRNHVVQNPKFMRAPEMTTICSNPQRANEILGWKPTTSFVDLVRLMVRFDLDTERTSASS